MPHKNPSYRKMASTARRRKMWRRMTLIVCLTFTLAYFLPNLVANWLHLGDRVVESMKPYSPYDFEREAWLAGQEAGQKNESMTGPEYEKYYKKRISEVAPKKTTDTLKVYDFAFDAGYKKTSDYKKRYIKKR
jgi:hypothetical protein